MSTAMIRQRRLALICMGVALGMATIFMASRVGLPGNTTALSAVLKALSLTTATATVATLMPRLLPWKGMGLGATAVLAGMGGLAIFYGLSWLPGGMWVVYALAAAGTIASVPAMRLERGVGQTLAWAVAAALLILVLALYALPRSNPPFAAEQALSRHLFIDGYYHMAVSQMIRWFGVAAAGFDGMAADHYHYGLDFMAARMSVLLDSDIPYFFPAFMHLTVLPLLVWALVATASDVAESALLPLTVAVLAAIILYASVTNDVVFISASQMASLVLVVASFPLFRWIGDHPRRTGEAEAPAWTWALALGLLFVIWAFKVSAGMLMMGTFGWLVLRGGRSFCRLTVAGLSIMAVSALAASQFMNFNDHASAMEVSLFRYYWADEVKVWRRPFFFLIYSAFPLIFMAARLVEERVGSLRALGAVARQGRITDVEVMALLWLAGYLPGALLFTHDLVWIYFYDLPAWLALPLVAGRVSAAWRGCPRASGPARLSGTALLALILLAPTLEVMGAMMMKRTGRFIAEIVETHNGLSGKTLPERNDLGERGEAAMAALADPVGTWKLMNAAKESPIWAAHILDIAIRHRTEHGRNAALYIPPTNREFWSERLSAFVSTAMFVPAMTGVPLIDGRPPLPFVKSYGYGFVQVEPRTDDVPLDDEHICAQAARWGLGPVYWVESLSDLSANRLVDCTDR